MPEKAKVSPILAGLLGHRVMAPIKDLDHYRSGMAVETDYIIHVSSKGKDFEPFVISKTFHAFRDLADSLNEAAEAIMWKEGNENLPKKVRALAKYCYTVLRLCESQKTEYFGKMNYQYCKTLAKQRSHVLTQVLDATLTEFPDEIDSHPFLAKVAKKIEAFFLSDHVNDDDGEDEKEPGLVSGLLDDAQAATSSLLKPIKKNVIAPIKKDLTQVKKGINKAVDQVKESTQDAFKSKSTKDAEPMDDNVSARVVPTTRKVRRKDDEAELSARDTAANDASDKAQAGRKIEASWVGIVMDDHPILFVVVVAGALQGLKHVGGMVATVDIDILFLSAFASFCLGYYTPHPSADKKGKGRKAGPTSAAALLKRASARGLDIEDEGMVLPSPMPRFPEGAELGSVVGCWSDPPPTVFNVRGDNYLTDKKKVPSGPFLFKNRGLDLFLTDACPENVGRISSLMDGGLRDVPTFIINFRLPWGVLVFYSEIPERFVPFIKGCYNDPSVNKTELEAKIKAMNNQDRCCARFLLGDDEQKNNTLKIFPMVVVGPWVVKSVVGGKPAIIGTKLPVNYVYAPEGEGSDGKKQALYLEADLDIVSSSAARSILSVVRSYTQDLTIDLGFGIQGNSNDELRENMLVGTRIHGIDPLNSPSLPPIADDIMADAADAADGDD